ncbi:MAG: hypothetical protein GY832_14480, partial [Chloroflexi bacterium]|nr:hypothetical protein [Chloroflexota bacterium]
LNTSARAMAYYLEHRAKALSGIARGDLTITTAVLSSNDIMGEAMHNMVADLNNLVGEIYRTAEIISRNSQNLTNRSVALAEGAIKSASSLEEVASSMTEISSQVQANLGSASEANKLAGTVRTATNTGDEKMQNLVGAMDTIKGDSQKIANIIQVIDDIAFQTNLLALNAAVEAARAGKHGKGFAVVADEVRNLAARSAKAARETASMIEDSVKLIGVGSSTAEDTAKSLTEVVQGIGQVATLVSDITTASEEQSLGIVEISGGLDQIDVVTQQNASLADDAASAVKELNNQTSTLVRLLSHFHLSASGSNGDSENEGGVSGNDEEISLEVSTDEPVSTW